MALVDPNKTQRYDIPGEPGEWVELRPLTTRDFLQTTRAQQDPNADKDVISAAFIMKAIKAWSYDAPIDEETILTLDPTTFFWLSGLNPGRDDDAKKNLDSPSSPTTPPARVNSRQNLVT